ncbi:uncharacterized protein MYCFIDRAFT_81458 [Pseudocercospora fijiensis CIRAD86]|uniref:F-box domain-containing protein n=1 Tax=Pseudocercospora fijiensis (strain CIRAD86) TaxID=383855 RepID=M3A9T9_PSEFD|nr:uncharacterized protein MYCFIDRAFT_81458 [Pseudocercospora fijiensis CIRAD86]EME81396.1 hypothetical protein MYCFIDRAFT_81458 [Pseudocercospora fijiensis CIRAD86]
MAAATAVFGTAELSEMILLHLPMRDLLRVQRVDKDINAVISGSKALRRKLFFESAPGGPLTHFLNRNGTISSYSSGERAIYKKRVRNLPEGMEEAMKFDEMWHKGKDAPGVPVPVELNPVFAYAMREVERAMMAGNFTQASLPSSWRRPEASWRRMKMTQPSTEFTLFIQYWSVRVSKTVATLPVRPDTDLGQLVDTIYERPYIDSIKKSVKSFIKRKTLRDIHFVPAFSYLWDLARWKS